MSGRGVPFLSIVLPCYNEEAYLEGAVSAITSRMAEAGFPYEILVVDDGSRDGTAAKARALIRRREAMAGAAGAGGACELRLLSHSPNRGKGRAVRRGVAESRGRFVIFMDVDLSTSPSYIPAFLTEAAAGADVVVASRYTRDRDVDLSA